MAFIDELREENETAYETWFERWYEKKGIEKTLMESAKKGVDAYKMNVTPSNRDDDAVKYQKRRLNDKRIIELLKNKLGHEFDIKFRTDTTEYTILFSETVRTERKNYIVISWGGKSIMDEMKDLKDMNIEKARYFLARRMGKEWTDEMTDEEIEKIFVIMFNVTKRKVQNIWDAVSKSIAKMALDRAEEKGITYEQAIDEMQEEIKKRG